MEKPALNTADHKIGVEGKCTKYLLITLTEL
jgi:hypothetical protein